MLTDLVGHIRADYSKARSLSTHPASPPPGTPAPAQAGASPWLETLVWPSETHRLHRLRAAIELAEAEALTIEPGDLHSDALDRLIARAPKGATLVVYHSAVLSYTPDPSQRDAFARRMRGLPACWLSNESPALFTDFGQDLARQRPGSDFLMALNGRPIAWADPHGASVTWIDTAAETPRPFAF